MLVGQVDWLGFHCRRYAKLNRSPWLASYHGFPFGTSKGCRYLPGCLVSISQRQTYVANLNLLIYAIMFFHSGDLECGAIIPGVLTPRQYNSAWCIFALCCSLHISLHVVLYAQYFLPKHIHPPYINCTVCACLFDMQTTFALTCVSSSEASNCKYSHDKQMPLFLVHSADL